MGSCEDIRQAIVEGRTVLGIELGSTRVKAVLIDETHTPVAAGGYDWENRLEDGVWTYHLDDAWTGLRQSFASLAEDVRGRYGVALEQVGAIGISGMMHGYLPFDAAGRQLAMFRTWRNTTTAEAAGLLSEEFHFSIPQRWSVAHLYQAMLNREPHVNEVAFLTTLAGYVHWKLTGEKVVGVNEASGMFPIDSAASDFHAGMMDRFGVLAAAAEVPWRLPDILPRVLRVGERAGVLTEEGAKLLDPSGALRAGIPMCPPEGDAGTGMVATNSVATRTGNISAGTSIFAMVVLENALSRPYAEIDMVATPAGSPVAMVHCNNCTSDLDAWVKLLGEFAQAAGHPLDKNTLYETLYHHALEGEADCGGLLTFNYLSGEHLTGLEAGRPLFARLPESRLSLANFARALLFSTMATLRLGMDILTGEEHVALARMLGHGGLFKVKGVGQKLMAGALNVPVAVMESAGEGGAWGIALLAAYMLRRQPGELLETYLADRVFAGMASMCVQPDGQDVRGFDTFMARYKDGLAIERAAVEHLR